MNLIAMNFFSDLGDMLVKFGLESGFAQFFNGVGWKNLIIARAHIHRYAPVEFAAVRNDE